MFQASATPGEGQYPASHPSTARLIGLFGENTADLQHALDLLRQQPGEQPAVVPLTKVTALPRQWYGYESLDALILSTSNAQLFANLKPEGPEILALDKWIRMGGRLVLCVGSQAEKILASGAPLARFSPGTLQQTIPLTETTPWESYVNSSERVSRERARMLVPQLQGCRGTIELQHQNLPLVIRTPWGLGQVISWPPTWTSRRWPAGRIVP